MKLKKNQGFTLIEAVLVVALIAIMMVVISELFFNSNRAYLLQETELSLNYSARMTLDDIDAHVRQAVRTLDAYDIYTAGSDTLIVEIQSVDSSNQLVPGMFDVVVFHLSSGKVFREIYADPSSTRVTGNKLLGENVSSLVFTYDHANFALVRQVTTNLSISKPAAGSIRTITLSSKSSLRN